MLINWKLSELPDGSVVEWNDEKYVFDGGTWDELGRDFEAECLLPTDAEVKFGDDFKIIALPVEWLEESSPIGNSPFVITRQGRVMHSNAEKIESTNAKVQLMGRETTLEEAVREAFPAPEDPNDEWVDVSSGMQINRLGYVKFEDKLYTDVTDIRMSITNAVKRAFPDLVVENTFPNG